jgi:glucokinase-like ROK family protein
MIGIPAYPPVDLHFRNLNKHVTLDLIRYAKGGISRADIARRMDLSRAAVTGIINDLIDRGLVREASNVPSVSGRRPVMLEINPALGYVLGIDLGATHLEIVVADFSGRIVADRRSEIQIQEGPQQCLGLIIDEAVALLDAAGLSMGQISAAGVGVPGPIISEAGMVRMPPLMPGWDKFPIRSHLESHWGIPVSLNNDAELGALGEWAFGAGRGEHNLAYIKVGTGVGAGLILDGRIYRGTSGCAGEIGHITIKEQGPRCACGNRGCLEVVAGGRAIAQQAQRAILANRSTILAEIKPVETITAEDVAEAARRGDLISQQIIAEAGGYLGTAIASLVNLINPGMIVIGGGLAQMGDLLLEPVRQAVVNRSISAAAESVRIVTAVLGNRSASIGAVTQALEIALHNLTDR